MKKACCLFCCCSCVILLMVLVLGAILLFLTIQKGLEPPPEYARSEMPLDLERGKELYRRIAEGQQKGRLEVILTRQDLRNLVAAKLDEALQRSRGVTKPKLSDVQVDFGSPEEIARIGLPQAYPVAVSESVRLDLIAAVNFASEQDPFILYFQTKLLAGANNCNLYWTIVDVGLGPYSLLRWLKVASEAGATTDIDFGANRLPLPPGTCASELSRSDEGLRIVLGPEKG